MRIHARFLTWKIYFIYRQYVIKHNYMGGRGEHFILRVWQVHEKFLIFCFSRWQAWAPCNVCHSGTTSWPACKRGYSWGILSKDPKEHGREVHFLLCLSYPYKQVLLVYVETLWDNGVNRLPLPLPHYQSGNSYIWYLRALANTLTLLQQSQEGLQWRSHGLSHCLTSILITFTCTLTDFTNPQLWDLAILSSK